MSKPLSEPEDREGAEIAGNPAPISFAVLGQDFAHTSADSSVQLQSGVTPSVRKACAMLRTTAAIMTAITVHPGAESGDNVIADTAQELMARAAALGDAAMEILGVRDDHPRFAQYRNMIRQQATETVSAQWRLSHGASVKDLSITQLTEAFRATLSKIPLEEQEESAEMAMLDPVRAKRVALFGVVSEIYAAVNGFDYFNPSPEKLVEKGVRTVSSGADRGVRMLMPDAADLVSEAVVYSSIVAKAGALYAANYRAHSRKDVIALQGMEKLERRRHVFNHRLGGLPTTHIDDSFDKLLDRMVAMVCDAVPELQCPDPQIDESPGIALARVAQRVSSERKPHAQPE